MIPSNASRTSRLHAKSSSGCLTSNCETVWRRPSPISGQSCEFSPVMLSVVVPVYNEVRTLGAILSILSGVLPDVSKEIIVVDDCSKDGTREWLKANFPDGPRTGSRINVDAGGNLSFDSGSTG